MRVYKCVCHVYPKLPQITQIRLDLKFKMLLGRPLPTVTWWIDNQMVDDTYYSESGDTVINFLSDTKATRYSVVFT